VQEEVWEEHRSHGAEKILVVPRLLSRGKKCYSIPAQLPTKVGPNMAHESKSFMYFGGKKYISGKPDNIDAMRANSMQ
jgi:hypothetical protein